MHITRELGTNMAIRYLALTTATLLLAACGSGGKEPPAGFPNPPQERTASSIVAVADVASIPANGSQNAVITAIARDASNVLLPNVVVNFSATSGGIAGSPGTTDSVGEAKMELSTAGDPTPRTITVTATTAKGSLSHSVNVVVQ